MGGMAGWGASSVRHLSSDTDANLMPAFVLSEADGTTCTVCVLY